MSYYTEGGYVGYDPYEEHDRNKHKELYHKSEVPATKELVEYLDYKSIVDESKKYSKKPEPDSDEFMDVYFASLENIVYESMGDPHKTLELSIEDSIKNNNVPKLIETEKEHIIREGVETFIVYMKVDGEIIVLGVFYDRSYAEDFLETIKNKI